MCAEASSLPACQQTAAYGMVSVNTQTTLRCKVTAHSDWAHMPCAPSRGVQCAGVACMHDSSRRPTSLACIRCHDCMKHGAPLLLCRPASRVHSTGRSQRFQARCPCLPACAAGSAPRGLRHSCGRTLLRCRSCMSHSLLALLFCCSILCTGHPALCTSASLHTQVSQRTHASQEEGAVGKTHTLCANLQLIVGSAPCSPPACPSALPCGADGWPRALGHPAAAIKHSVGNEAAASDPGVLSCLQEASAAHHAAAMVELISLCCVSRQAGPRQWRLGRTRKGDQNFDLAHALKTQTHVC